MIHTNSVLRSRSRVLTPAGALLLAVLVPLACCERREEGVSGHDAPVAEDRHAEGDGHDHDAGDVHADEVTLTGGAIERYGVKVGEAEARTLEATFIAPARVGFNAEAMAHVGSPLSGRAVEIKARLGDRVKKGDALVVVESPELGHAQADYLLKRASARSAAPQVDLARAAWERAKGLFDRSQGLSLTEVQKREGEYRAALANLESAEAMAVAAENALRVLGMDRDAVGELASTGEIVPRSTIRAAIDGRVVQREVTLGELVNPDREPLMILADTGVVWVLADVPEARLPTIVPGAKAWVVIGTGSDEKYEGTVAFISPLVDPATRTAQVRVEAPSGALGDGAARPGMFAQVEIVAAPPRGGEGVPRVAVPQEAVQTIEGGPAVFVPVAGEPGTFQKRAITIGPAVGGFVPVLAGLLEGEKYVEAGSFILKAELGKGSAAHEH